MGGGDRAHPGGGPPPPLRDPLPDRVDVVVIGGGIAGASAAYHIAAGGASIALLERGRLGGGATAAAVGVLSPPMRQPFQETVKARGEEAARAIWAFARRSVQGLGELLVSCGEADNTALDLSGGHVLAEPWSDAETQRSFAELERAGEPVTWLSAARVRDLTGGAGFTGGYRLEVGGSLSPGPAARALARAARERGAVVSEETEVSEVRKRDGGFVCAARGHELPCDMVVYATHVDSRRFSSFLGDEIVPVRGQGFATAPVDATFRGSFATHWKMNVWRQTPSGSLVVGGWRHDAWERAYYRSRPTLDQALQGDLLRWFEAAFPRAAPLRVENRWSGIFGWTADFLPIVGQLPGRPGELVAAGFSGGGLPFAFESGRLIAHAVAGRDAVPGGELFNPRRFA